MIIGLFIRYFKTYSGWTYLPLSNGDSFCGLIGENGIGKSSVLEALDCFFNDRAWNINTQFSKAGEGRLPPVIAPVFLVDGKKLNLDFIETIQKDSQFLQNPDMKPPSFPAKKNFYDHIDDIKKLHPYHFEGKDLILAPINEDGHYFEQNLFLNLLENIDDDAKEKLIKVLKTYFKYIYIPSELDMENFTKLENQKIQGLMGETLDEIVTKAVGQKIINDVNTHLYNFTAQINKSIAPYEYKTNKRNQKLTTKSLNELIIKAFFSNQLLHLGNNKSNKSLEINQLSSGEKKKALVDIMNSFLEGHEGAGKKIILAIDEPEVSLHLSACYAQFEKLLKISENCVQVIFATHWYGFLPIIQNGYISSFVRKEHETKIDRLDLSFYREQIKESKASSKSQLPHNLQLKSINDLVQSILASIILDDPYSWLIVEGTSEKIYFTHFFEHEIKNRNLRIIPVGGAPEIKKIYEYVSLAADDIKEQIKGKVYFLSDTDEKHLDYETKSTKNIENKRIVFESAKNTIRLVKINDNRVSPATVIEDALDGEIYLETLKQLTKGDSNYDFLSDVEKIKDNVSFNYLDLKNTQKDKIKDFFKTQGNKFKFAKAYVANNKKTELPWITDVKDFLFNEKT